MRLLRPISRRDRPASPTSQTSTSQLRSLPQWPPCASTWALTTRASNSSRPSSSTSSKTGHEPIDCGAYIYDAEDDYPAFCIAAAVKTVADPESLGIVIGGSGNGEQIAANKVPGARCALAWSVETATLAREHNNAQVIGIGGRMHTVERGAGDRRRVPEPPSGRKPNGTNVVSTSSPSTRRRTSRRRCPARRPRDARRPHAAPAGPAASAPVRPCAGAWCPARRAGSPTAPLPSTDGSCKKASAWGKHLFHHYEGGRVVHVHLGLYGTFTEVPIPMPLPVGQVRMRMIGAEYGTDLRGPTVCEVIEEPEVADVVARLGPDPLRRDADGALAWARIRKSRRPIGALLMDQTVIAGVGNVYRNELLYRHRIDPYRPGTHIDEAEFDAMWTDLVELMKVGFRRGKIIVVRPEDDHGAAVVRAQAGPAPTSTAARASRAGCAARRSAPRCWRAATCSGARPARSRVTDATIGGWN